MNEPRPISYRQRWREFVMNGVLKPIASSAAGLLVYLCYLTHANDDGFAWMGDAKIADAMGISTEKVRRGRRAAEAAGLIIQTAKYKHRCKVYRVARTPHNPVGSEDGDTPQACGRTPHNPVGRTSHNGAHDTTQLCVTKVEEGRKEGSSKGTAAGSVPIDAADEPSPLRVALAAAGIAGKNLDRLAALPYLRPTIVRQVAEIARAKGLGPGAIVEDLDAKHAALSGQAAAAAQRQARQAHEAEQQRKTREQDERARNVKVAWYESLSPEELAGYEQGILASMTKVEKRLAQPGSRVLREYVMKRHQFVGGTE